MYSMFFSTDSEDQSPFEAQRDYATPVSIEKNIRYNFPIFWVLNHLFCWVFCLSIFETEKAGQPNRKNPLTCAEQMEAEIAKYDVPLDGAWSCHNPLVESGKHGLATCRINCNHGGKPKAVIRCRTLGRKLRAKKMDRQVTEEKISIR